MIIKKYEVSTPDLKKLRIELNRYQIIKDQQLIKLSATTLLMLIQILRTRNSLITFFNVKDYLLMRNKHTKVKPTQYWKDFLQVF